MEKTYVCNNLSEVKQATDNLCIAQILPLKVDDGGILKDVTNYKGIYNVTKGQFCTAVANNYNLIGHKEYFNAFAEAMTRLNMKYTMKITESGNKAYADIKFENKNIKFDKLNEEFNTGVRLVNSYDKTTGLYLTPMYTRLACTNGMVITRGENTISIRHNSKIILEIQTFIERELNHMISQDEQLQRWVSESMLDSIEWQSACKILQKLFTQPKHLEQILKRLNISLIHTRKSKDKVANYMFQPDNEEVKTKKLDRWILYNCVTDYLTRGEHLTPQIENSMQRIAERILITNLKKLETELKINVNL